MNHKNELDLLLRCVSNVGGVSVSSSSTPGNTGVNKSIQVSTGVLVCLVTLNIWCIPVESIIYLYIMCAIDCMKIVTVNRYMVDDNAGRYQKL